MPSFFETLTVIQRVDSLLAAMPSNVVSDLASSRIYDVFLSHNSREKAAVERLAQRLKREGFEPWLDKWYLTPGGDWQDELAEGLRLSKSCAVFIGPDGVGNWERLEFKLATDRMARDRNFRVFLVLLPGLPEAFDTALLPPFLCTRTWVDIRKGAADSDALRTLINAVRGVPPGADMPSAASGDICPYRGLRPFDEEHSEFFYGREADVQRLIEKLKTSRFLAVLGPSGSGKTSVVRAGLIKALRDGAFSNSEAWTVRVFTPSAQPLTQMAAILVHLNPQLSAIKTLDELRDDERALHLAASVTLAERPQYERMVLVIDQFEEVFSLCRDETERARFIANLLYAATAPGGRCVVIITMRADFYHKCVTYPELSAHISGHQFLVSSMSVEGLRQAIVEPAWRVGLGFEEGLVDTILEDVENQPGALPLLEHALLELWERRRRDILTLQAYREAGGVEHAIAKRADAAFDSFDVERQSIVRRVMLRLTEPGDGTEDTRRRATLTELITQPDEAEKVQEVVEILVDARLLTAANGAEDGSGVIDVSHEALIRGWPRLSQWVEEDRQGLRMHRRLTEAAEEWQRSRWDNSLLFRGARLTQITEWRDSNQSALNEIERAFLDASVNLQVKERQLTQKSTHKIIAGLVVALLFISVATVYALIQGSIAVKRGKEAFAREVAANALAQLSVDPELGLLLAIEAAHTAHTIETENTLRQALVKSPIHIFRMSGIKRASFSADSKYMLTSSGKKVKIWDVMSGRGIFELEHDDEVFDATFSPDGKVIATTSKDTLQVWDAGTGRSIATGRTEGDVGDVTFSSDGKFLFTQGELLRVWDLGAQHPLAELDLRESKFSGDGNSLIGLVEGKTVKVYTRSDARWQPSAELQTTRSRYSNILITALSYDGRFVVVGADDGFIVYDQGGTQLLQKLGEGSEKTEVAFSPDGKLFAAASYGEVYFWETGDWSGGGAARIKTPHDGTVSGLTFSPDGRLILTRDVNNLARLFRVASGRLLAEFGSSVGGGVQDAQFSPDGKLLFTINVDGSVWLWDLNVWRSQFQLQFATLGTYIVDDSSEKTKLRGNMVYFNEYGLVVTTQGHNLDHPATNVALVQDRSKAKVRTIAALSHNQKIRGISISPDGKRILTTSDDNIARVWDLETGGRTLYELTHTTRLTGAAFSPDSQIILSVSGKTAWVWDANDGRLLETFNAAVIGTDVAFSPNDKLVLVAIAGGAQLWDLSRKQVLLEWRDEAKEEPMLGSSSDGKFTLAANKTSDTISSLQVRDLASKRTVVELRGHTDNITSGAFSPNGQFVVTTSEFVRIESLEVPDSTNTVRIWDVNSGNTFYELQGFIWPVLAGAFSPDGRYILAGFSYPTATILITPCEMCVSYKEMIDLAWKRNMRQLTPEERTRYLHEEGSN